MDRDQLRHSLSRVSRRDPEFAKRFYASLFAAHPEVRALFAPDISTQERKFDATLRAITEIVRDADVRALGRLHEERGALPEHYPIVCNVLIDVLRSNDDQWSPELEAQWRAALTTVTERMTRK